ncbi:hypothetical protein MSAR_19450 [Mycolicibacterium sarraceniae]|uniref:Uncharacterized protein n=1 Tax=Mycolicibacterium sarraceniae TaxID=1534348 RepID=A0A7I7SRN3_9MYCO|nr:hypothetical protein MSAR_19450 [Mycolicibacterium sarraceniae]
MAVRLTAAADSAAPVVALGRNQFQRELVVAADDVVHRPSGRPKLVNTRNAYHQRAQERCGLISDFIAGLVVTSDVRRATHPKYLHDGDVIEASVRTDDGTIALGTQRMPVTYG